MSGHSKWSQIKRQKGVADSKKGTLFTKLGNAIAVAAREGGGDVNTNFKLRLAIEKSKQANMPNANIERAIQRGAGTLGAQDLHEVLYEAFGPCGIALLLFSVTDNTNRTLSAVRSILAKHQGRLGEAHTVQWMFEKKGVLRVVPPKDLQDRERFELLCIDQGAEDIRQEDETVSILCSPEALFRIKNALEHHAHSIQDMGIEYIPKTPVFPQDVENSKKIEALCEELSASEEIEEFYSTYVG